MAVSVKSKKFRHFNDTIIDRLLGISLSHPQLKNVKNLGVLWMKSITIT